MGFRDFWTRFSFLFVCGALFGYYVPGFEFVCPVFSTVVSVFRFSPLSHLILASFCTIETIFRFRPAFQLLCARFSILLSRFGFYWTRLSVLLKHFGSLTPDSRLFLGRASETGSSFVRIATWTYNTHLTIFLFLNLKKWVRSIGGIITETYSRDKII